MFYHVYHVYHVDVNDFVDVQGVVDTNEERASSCGMSGDDWLVINFDNSILVKFCCFPVSFLFSCFLVIFFFRQIPSHGNTAEVVLTALHRYNYNYIIIYYHISPLVIYDFFPDFFFINRNLLGVDQFLGR